MIVTHAALLQGSLHMRAECPAGDAVPPSTARRGLRKPREARPDPLAYDAGLEGIAAALSAAGVVDIRVKLLTEAQWKNLGRVVAREAVFAARLLAGEMPGTWNGPSAKPASRSSRSGPAT